MRISHWLTSAVVVAFAGSCELGSFNASDNTQPSPNPPANNNPGNTPSTPNPPAPGDPSSPIDLSPVVWLHANVAGWPVTSHLSVSIGGGSVNLNYDAARSWPTRNVQGTAANANPWIFVNRGGTWYAATWEWLRPGQTAKPMGVVNGAHIKVSPLNNFRPVSGETYGWMVSTLARGGERTINERTNIVMATWP